VTFSYENISIERLSIKPYLLFFSGKEGKERKGERRDTAEKRNKERKSSSVFFFCSDWEGLWTNPPFLSL
jgi:hypothetical protein